MPLPHDEITSISAEIIRQCPQSLELVGVAAAEGGSSRVELMVTVKGCHEEPCRLVLNLPRGDRRSFETELRLKLQTLLRTHVTSAESSMTR
jgi:hypothetical protein